MDKKSDKAPRKRGRPREFHREEALERAMLVFWQHGYEATSMGDLTAAMGLSASSLYAAFGDKEALYNAAIEQYMATRGSYPVGILQEAPDARAALERLFAAAARELTRTDQPAGCMVALAMMHCSAAAAPLRESMRARREGSITGIRDLIQRDIDLRRLPKATDAVGLARFFATVLHGMSIQARDGASREALERIGATAMQVWPPASGKK